MSELRIIKSKANDNVFPVGIIDSTGRTNSYSTHVTISKPEGLFNAPITTSLLAELVIKRSQHLGTTTCFFFRHDDDLDYQDAIDLIDESLLTRISDSANISSPSDVKHSASHSEKSYTATGDKLSYHWPIFQKLAETNHGSIIRASIAPYQKCSSSCSFCSTANRNINDTVPLEDAKRFIDSLCLEQAEYNRKNFSSYNNKYKELTGSDIKLRSLILTGGGQPNLWPDFSEFVKYAHSLGIELGLITNGFPKNIDEEIYSLFKWIRISITPADASPHYINGLFENQYLPSNFSDESFLLKTTVGLSYVMGPWTKPNDLKRLNKYVDEKDFHYCRLLTDCNLPRDLQLKEHHRLSQIIETLEKDSSSHKKSKLFHQFKYHAANNELNEVFEAGQCYLQTYGLFWDSTGHSSNKQSYCYPCDSVTVLASNDTGMVVDSARKFEPSIYGTVPWNKVSELYKKAVHPFFDPREACSGCLFFRNNKKVSQLVGESFPLKLNSFNAPHHVNFP